MAIEVFKLFGSIMVDNEKANKSISETDKKAEGLGSKLIKGIGTVGKWGTAIVGAAGIGGAAMLGMANKSAQATDRIDKMSQKIGLSRKAFQEFDFICSQSGMSVDKLQGGFKTLTNQLDAASEGNKEATENFKKLGFSMDELKTMSREDIFKKSIGALQNVSSETEKAALANKLFGRAGSEMMPLLNGASGSIEEMTKKAHELGLVLSDDAIDSGVKFTDTVDQLKRSFGSVVTKIGTSVMPMFQKLADWTIENMPTIQAILDTVFKAIEWGVTLVGNILGDFFNFLTGALDGTGVTWTQVWETCKNTFLAFAKFITDIWNTLGKPIFDLIVSMVGWVKDIFMEHWPMISSFFGQFVRDCKTMWEEHLKPMFQAIGDFIRNVLAPAFKFVFENIIGPVVGAVFKNIVNLWNNFLKPVFTGIIDFITGVFTGNWRKAFEGLKSIVSGVFGGLISIVKSPLNIIISLVNKFIKGLNKIKVPSFVPLIGGKNINLPEIPMLAKGTNYFKGGAAIVGEQGPELVTMPRGAKVTPNKQTENVLKQNKEPLQANIYFDGRMIMRLLAPYKEELDMYDLRFV